MKIHVINTFEIKIFDFLNNNFFFW